MPLYIYEVSGDPAQQVEWFALVNLGIVQALVSGTLSVGEALERFYHTDFMRLPLRERRRLMENKQLP